MISTINSFVSNVVKTVKSPFMGKTKGKNGKSSKSMRCRHSGKCKCN